jgi:lipopolysaccharide transport system ATP-binding protein
MSSKLDQAVFESADSPGLAGVDSGPDDVAIRVSGLAKCFQIYDRPRDRLLQFVMPRLRRAFSRTSKQYFRDFWALHDVSFEIRRGETVGIVGRNGSGKSTLLQIICGTLSPSGGSVETYGRIAALLELGSGFNPEFTGRENVYMNGAVLGLSRAEVDRRFEDIVAFAEIGDFIDQPVKSYSSGMQVRLAFAVAINVDPEILVVDEALSVGDERFQRKCFSRIEEIRGKGATILFVSHSGNAIVELCDKAILLDGGECLAIGKPKAIIGRYQRLLYAAENVRAKVRNEIIESYRAMVDTDTSRLPVGAAASVVAEPPHSDEESLESYDPALRPSSTINYESYGATIEHPMVLTMDGKQVNNLRRGQTYQYVYTVRFHKGAGSVVFGMLIKSVSGLEFGGAVSAAQPSSGLQFVQAETTLQIRFEFQCNLAPGVYFLNAGVQGDVDGTHTYMHRLLDVAMFRVMPERGLLVTGYIDFGCIPRIEHLADADS